MKPLIPSNWQREGINGLVRRLSGRGPTRAALLQLPTGFGKSLVAVRVFEALRRRKPSLGLVVVVPKQQAPSGWLSALGFRSKDDVPWFEWTRAPFTKGPVRFETRLSLVRAALCPKQGRPPKLATELHSRPRLIVVDEVHRHRRLLDTLAEIFLSSGSGQSDSLELSLTKPFRSPARGVRQWPKWLLLSATPFNPVRLDTVDPLDTGPNSRYASDWNTDDEQLLANELEKTLGALAWLAGHSRSPWFDGHIETARTLLSNGNSGPVLKSPKQLIVWPPSVKTQTFSPRANRRWVGKERLVDARITEKALKQVIATADTFRNVHALGHWRRVIAERFVLSGGPMHVEGGRIEGQSYGVSLANSIRKVVAIHRKRGYGRPEKLNALSELIFREAVGEHILVFCIHRAVAVAAAQSIRAAVGEEASGSQVRTAIGKIEERDRRWFNQNPNGKTRVLVATDACSESIDLHHTSNLLVHYELPWSPLRVLQRVGRLWRIRPKEIRARRQPGTPHLPGVVHFAHPGSADEEILARLQRRWGHLAVLGLDYLTFDEALGLRLPAVAWPPGG